MKTTGRILIADDDASLLGYAQRYLVRLGYEVVPCRSARVAREAFEAEPESFALIIVDMSMAQGEVTDLARKFQAVRSEIPVLYWSGFPINSTQLKSGHAGDVEFLGKPFSPRQLAETVKRLLLGRAEGCGAGE